MSPMSSWLASPPPDAAIEIAADHVAAVTLSFRGSTLAVGAYAVEPLAAGLVTPSLTGPNIVDRAAVAGVVTHVLGRLGTRVRRTALIVPDTTVKVSLLRFEHVPPRRDDLDQLVRWQLRKAAPFAVEEACVTYSPGIAVDATGREFVVEVARREAIREYESACEDAGVYAGLVETSTFGLLGLFSRPAAADDWLLVHVRPDYTSMVISRGDDVIFYRSRQEDEGAGLNDLVHQTAMYYEDRLGGQQFARVMLAGGSLPAGGPEAARRNLEERLGTAVEMVDPTRIAALPDRINASPMVMDVIGPLVGVLRRSSVEARA